MRNTINDKYRIELRVLGEFVIEYGHKVLTYEDIRSERLTKLLIYLMINHTKAISIQQLVDVLWVDDEINNPIGALKNLVYRLRNVLKKTLGDEDFIISARGTYSWNNNISINIDIEQMQDLYYKSKQLSTSKSMKYKYLQSIMNIYRGGIFKIISDEHWAMQLDAYYRTMYLKCVEELVAGYEKENKYGEIVNCCTKAISIEPLEESLYYYKIKAMIKQHNVNEAYEYYNKSKEYLCEKLGIHEPKKLMSIYDEFSSKIQANNSSIDDIDLDMNTRNKMTNKTFMCDYNVVFREIYRLEQRRIERLGIQEYMVLFTVNVGAYKASEGEIVTKALNKAVDILGKAIENSLRSGDIASRCRELQYIALLPNCPENMVDRVSKRIIDKYRDIVIREKCQLQFKKYGINISYDLKSISKENLVSVTDM